MDIKIWKNFTNLIIVAFIFLLALSFFQFKSIEENILSINPFPGDDNTVSQFQVKSKYPKQILKNQKTELQFVIFQIDSEKVNKTMKTTELNSTDLFEKFSVNFESRLEIPGIFIEPSGEISQNFVENKKLNHKWDLYPTNQGVFQGTLWLYINLIPLNPSDDPVNEILLAKPIQIEVITIFGLSSNWVRIICIALLISFIYLKFKLFLKQKEKENQKAL